MTTQKEELHGVWTALITPFRDDGDIDYEAFQSLIKRQVDGKVRGVVLCGTTGEAPTLSVTEKLSLVKRASVLAEGKLRLMVGCGSNDTAQTVELSKLCVDAGAQALMVVTPPYNKPPLRGLKAHYQAVCEANPHVPVVVYHVPGRTGHKLSYADLGELLSCHKNICAVKEASGQPIDFSRYMISTTASVVWLSGDDHGFLSTLAVGGHGLVSVAANVFPQAIVQIHNSFMAGHHEHATRLHQLLFSFMDELFSEVNPVPVKAVLHEMGLIGPYLRLPLMAADASSSKRLGESYQNTVAALHNVSL